MNTLNSLWKYWDKPNPKARLDKVEDPVHISNHDAIIFCIKFVAIALAIFFAFLTGMMV